MGPPGGFWGEDADEGILTPAKGKHRWRFRPYHPMLSRLTPKMANRILGQSLSSNVPRLNLRRADIETDCVLERIM